MCPTFLTIFGYSLKTYGLMVATGFYVATKVIERAAKLRNLDTQKITDLVFWGFIVGIVGARVLFIITDWQNFLNHPTEIIAIWRGGLVYFGGFLAVIPFLIYYSKKNQLPLLKTLDCCTLGLVIGHAIGRFGCLASGCCYGKPTELFWGVRFYSEFVASELHGIPLHPTQLYESFALFVLFGLLWFIFKRARFYGQVACTYLLTYPIIRSVLEVFRGDLVRGFVVKDYLSTSQFISIFVFIVGVISCYRLSKNHKPG
jgi:phosphatidylglycerol:prolipoprotein diacylglycerol transferase